MADADLVSIREFDSEGRFVREIGREGEGPGELRSIAGVSVLPDGRLAAWDRGNRRVTVYGIDGDYDHAIRVESVTPPYPFVDRAFLTDFAGNYYLRILVRSPFSGPDPLAMTDVRYGYARVSPDGVVLDTLVASDAPGASGAKTGQSIAIHTPAGDRSPFPVDMLDALSPLGYLVAGSQRDLCVLDSGPGRVGPRGAGGIPAGGREGRRTRRVARASGVRGAQIQDVLQGGPCPEARVPGVMGRLGGPRLGSSIRGGRQAG